MKKQIMFFAAAILLLSALHSCAQPVCKVEMTRLERRQKVLAAYISSLMLSGCVGAVTGGVVRYLEKKLNVEACPIGLFLTLLGWALESEFRNDVIAGVQKDLDAYHIEHKKSLMFKGAWIASWLAYLQT